MVVVVVVVMLVVVFVVRGGGGGCAYIRASLIKGGVPFQASHHGDDLSTNSR